MSIRELWDFNDPAGSEFRFRKALQDAAEQPISPDALELQTQIARAQGLQQQFDKAHATLDAVECALASRADDHAFAAAHVRLLLERGRVFNSSDDRDHVRSYFLRAWETACEMKLDALAVDAAHMMGIVAPAAEALHWNKRAIALAERSGDPEARQWLGSLYNNIGWTHHDRSEYDQATACFERALICRQQQGCAKDIFIARWCIGRCTRSLGRLEVALALQQTLLRDMEQAGEPCDGYLHEELAECLHALGRHEDARPHFQRACRLLSSDAWLARREPERLRRLAELGGE